MGLSFTIDAAVILRLEYHGTDDYILLFQIRVSPNLEGQVPVFISPRNRVVQLYPKHWVPFSSPLTTRRAKVEIFKPATTAIRRVGGWCEIAEERPRLEDVINQSSEDYD
jgi:hypothetical protein